jgi:serine protease
MDVPKPVPGDRSSRPTEPAVARPIRTPISSDPVIAVPAWLLARYNARVLDPATAVKTAGQNPIRPTVYLGDKLLVSGVAGNATRDALTKAAASKGLTLVPPLAHVARRDQLVEVARAAGRSDADSMFHTLVHLEPAAGTAVAADAWEVLQTFRALIGSDQPGAQHVGLDHLLTAARHIEATPFDPSSPGQNRAPMASYGEPGWGGRQPVNFLGDPPPRQSSLKQRRPVVAVLDTGVGDHTWFPFSGDVVQRNPIVNGAQLGLGEPAASEQTGVVADPLEGILDPYSGHGTFIAGLIHQQCPDADILSIRVMPSEGAVPEHTLLDALTLLALRQQAAQQAGKADEIVDVVSLSLGYYHEQPEDLTFDPLLLDPIRRLGQCGVVVVVSAGNDATTRPMFPAAFTPYAGGCVPAPDAGCVPVVSVGASNPDGSIALFSNAGPWVVCTQPGAALVSTFPKFDAAAQAEYAFHGPDGWRSTIDPDSFKSGFGVWSGTSFAAPVLAGKLARSLVDGDCGSSDPVDAASMLARGWAVVAAHDLAVQP